MRILFAITALCLFVLIWAGVAIRRHIRAAARERAERKEQTPALQAVEAELRNQLRTERTEAGYFGSISDPQPGRHISRTRQAVRDSAIREAAVENVPVVEVTYAAPEPLPEPVHTAEVTEPTAQAAPTESRKPPISINGGKVERMDWAHFNKDLGDLSDPYQVPRTNARNRS